MKYIRTKNGKIVDLEKFINKEKDTPYYKDFIFDEITKDGELKWTAVGTERNSMKEQRGIRCQFGATLNSEVVKQADTIKELICDDDILYIHDLYPDAVLVVEGNIKPFGYPEAIKLKEWLKYTHIKFDLFIKDSEGNYIKRATTMTMATMMKMMMTIITVVVLTIVFLLVVVTTDLAVVVGLAVAAVTMAVVAADTTVDARLYIKETFNNYK